MNNPVKTIYQWNKEADLLGKGYSDVKESAFSIEEMLEGFDLNYFRSNMKSFMISSATETTSPKELSRLIIGATGDETNNIPDVDRFDKHLDSIVYNFGSIFKLGLTPQQAMHGLQVVMDANMQKLKDKQVDEAGKVMKPKDFIGPEAELQKILLKRT